MSFATVCTVGMAMLLTCAVVPLARAGTNDYDQGVPAEGVPAVGCQTKSTVFWQSFPMQALIKVFPNWSPSKMGYIEVSNLPEASDDEAKSKVGQQLIATFHKSLQRAPEYDKALGFAVTRAWSPRTGFFLMELQNPCLAESAPRILEGLTVDQKKLGIRAITAGDVEAEGITLCGWARRQRFLIHLFLFVAAVGGIRAISASGISTSDIFGRKAAKATLPFHGASVVGGGSSFQAKRQTSCVARSLPKEWGGDSWEI